MQSVSIALAPCVLDSHNFLGAGVLLDFKWTHSSVTAKRPW